MGGAGPTVLVADDEEILRSLLIRILEGAGCKVISAGDGLQAVARFRADPAAVDVVVLDLTMPPDGGLAALRELLAERPDLGVILTSGGGLDRQARRLLESCGGQFVPKPFSPDTLLEALARVT